MFKARNNLIPKIIQSLFKLESEDMNWEGSVI